MNRVHRDGKKEGNYTLPYCLRLSAFPFLFILLLATSVMGTVVQEFYVNDTYVTSDTPTTSYYETDYVHLVGDPVDLMRRGYYGINVSSLGLSNNEFITSANLSIWIFTENVNDDSQNIQAFYCDTPLNDSVNWNNQPGGTTAGATAAHCNTTALYSLPDDGLDDSNISIDLASQVQREIESGDGTFWVMLRYEMENSTVDTTDTQFCQNEFTPHVLCDDHPLLTVVTEQITPVISELDIEFLPLDYNSNRHNLTFSYEWLDTINGSDYSSWQWHINGEKVNGTRGVYTGNSWATSGVNLDNEIAYYGGHYWVPSSNDDAVHQYTLNGVSTGVSWSISGESCDDVQGFAFGAGHFWVSCQDEQKVFKYTPNGTYTGQYIEPPLVLTLGALAWDGTHLHVSEEFFRNIYRYWPNGTYTGTNYWNSGINPDSMTAANGYLWVTNSGSDIVHQWEGNGTPTGYSFDTSVTGFSDAWGITYNNGTFSIFERTAGRVYEFLSDVLLSDQTSIGDTILLELYPYDGEQNGTTVSTSVVILEIEAPTLLLPGNGTTNSSPVSFTANSTFNTTLELIINGVIEETFYISSAGEHTFTPIVYEENATIEWWVNATIDGFDDLESAHWELAVTGIPLDEFDAATCETDIGNVLLRMMMFIVVLVIMGFGLFGGVPAFVALSGLGLFIMGIYSIACFIFMGQLFLWMGLLIFIWAVLWNPKERL